MLTMLTMVSAPVQRGGQFRAKPTLSGPNTTRSRTRLLDGADAPAAAAVRRPTATPDNDDGPSPNDEGPLEGLCPVLPGGLMGYEVATQVLDFIEELRGASFAVPQSVPPTHPGRRETKYGCILPS